MKYVYPILKKEKSGHLVLWDGPTLPLKIARKILKLRKMQCPEEEFFIYREEAWRFEEDYHGD